MHWRALDPKPHRTPGDGVWQNARHSWRSGSHSGCTGSPSTEAATGDSAPLGACALPAEPAGRRSDQHWQKAGLRDASSPDKTGTSMAAPAALCLTVSGHLAGGGGLSWQRIHSIPLFLYSVEYCPWQQPVNFLRGQAFAWPLCSRPPASRRNNSNPEDLLLSNRASASRPLDARRCQTFVGPHTTSNR